MAADADNTPQKTRWFSIPARFHLRYWPIWLLVGLLRLLIYLPYSYLIRLGSAIGSLLYHLNTRERKTAQTNIALCFPHLTAVAQQELVRANFREIGIAVFETALGWWASNRKLRGLLTVHGQENIDLALTKGHGAILLGAHYTSLEIVGRLFSQQQDFAVVYRIHKHPVIAWINDQALCQHYARALPREQVRSIIQWLRHNQVLWYTPDVDAGLKHSVFVPFFGVQAATVTATSRFAKMAKTAVIPVSFYRRHDYSGYDVYFKPALHDFPSEDLGNDALRINQLIEEAIKIQPAQYLWQYRRFKTRPPGEARLYGK